MANPSYWAASEQSIETLLVPTEELDQGDII
jgi:hypothetical protein